MFKRISLAALLVVCAACTSIPSVSDSAPNAIGPAVLGVLKNAGQQSYIQFSDYTTGNPVISTEAYVQSYTKSLYLPLTGAMAKGPFQVTGKSTFYKMVLAKYGINVTGHNDAPTTIGAEANYLQIGGDEYGIGSYRGIGFGFVYSNAPVPPAMLLYQEMDSTGNTSGSLCLANRASSLTITPVSNLCVYPGGQIQAAANYVPATDPALTTKSYVDSRTRIASATVLGEVKVGTGLTTNADGTLSVVPGANGVPAHRAIASDAALSQISPRNDDTYLSLRKTTDNTSYSISAVAGIGINDGDHFKIANYGVTNSLVTVTASNPIYEMVDSPAQGYSRANFVIMFARTTWEFVWSDSEKAWFAYQL